MSSNSKRKYIKCGRKNGVPVRNVKMVAKECRDEAEKTKAHLKLGSTVNVKDKTKDFPKYINSKMKAEENYFCAF